MGQHQSAGCLPFLGSRSRGGNPHSSHNDQVGSRRRRSGLQTGCALTIGRQHDSLFSCISTEFFYSVTSCLFLDELPRLCQVCKRFKELVRDGACVEYSRGLRLTDRLVQYAHAVNLERRDLLTEAGGTGRAVSSINYGGSTGALKTSEASQGTRRAGSTGSGAANLAAGGEVAEAIRGGHVTSSFGGGSPGGFVHSAEEAKAPGSPQSVAVSAAGHPAVNSTQGESLEHRQFPAEEYVARPPLLNAFSARSFALDRRTPIMEELLVQLLSTAPRMRVLVIDCQERTPLTPLLKEVLTQQCRSIEICDIYNSEGDVHSIVGEVLPQARRLTELSIFGMLGWTDQEMIQLCACVFSVHPSRLSFINVCFDSAILIKGAELAEASLQTLLLRNAAVTAFSSVRHIRFMPKGIFFQGRPLDILAELNQLCEFFPNCHMSLEGIVVFEGPQQPHPTRGSSTVSTVYDDEALLDAMFEPSESTPGGLVDAPLLIFHVRRLAACDFIANGLSEDTCCQFSSTQRIVVRQYEELLGLHAPVLPSIGVVAPLAWLGSNAGAAFGKRVQAVVDRLEDFVIVLPIDFSSALEIDCADYVGILRESQSKIRGIEIREVSAGTPDLTTPSMMELMISNVFPGKPEALRIVRITSRAPPDIHQHFIAVVVELARHNPGLRVVEISFAAVRMEAETHPSTRRFSMGLEVLRAALAKEGFSYRGITAVRRNVLLFLREPGAQRRTNFKNL
ncbi:hypothetical protein BESB_062150 [Besnoitia besnoiti]|uniref:F-box domain-containing protein n=1 Tax=Besnoitia besnoiti TaxID=94643 RepID=A0A2A9MA30_BESBE|nr:hypothetical protein BESB_062150 [Besnoitia besnoiti]PFH35328.1 hypothetical protein BESB_062150 [Besnoitia besnoiti]